MLTISASPPMSMSANANHIWRFLAGVIRRQMAWSARNGVSSDDCSDMLS
jgi:hypothetical protein